MKNSTNYLLAAGAVGVTLSAITNFLTADVAIATVSLLGIIAVVASDYSRRLNSLRIPGKIVRPSLRASRTPLPRVNRRAA